MQAAAPQESQDSFTNAKEVTAPTLPKNAPKIANKKTALIFRSGAEVCIDLQSTHPFSEHRL
jgi:hypothetical protein